MLYINCEQCHFILFSCMMEYFVDVKLLRNEAKLKNEIVFLWNPASGKYYIFFQANINIFLSICSHLFSKKHKFGVCDCVIEYIHKIKMLILHLTVRWLVANYVFYTHCLYSIVFLSGSEFLWFWFLGREENKS